MQHHVPCSIMYLLTTCHEHKYLLLEMISDERPQHIKLFVKVTHNITLSQRFWCAVLGMFVHRHVHWVLKTQPCQVPYRSVWQRKSTSNTLKLLTFMGPYIINIFQYISNKMQLYTLYLYLETALHVSDGTSTHHQERIPLYLQHLVFVPPLLLPAAIM
jgi:hypothetical protein